MKKCNREEYATFKYQYICANGNVVSDGCASYDLMDKYSFGNVTEKPILEMYDIKPRTKKHK